MTTVLDTHTDDKNRTIKQRRAVPNKLLGEYTSHQLSTTRRLRTNVIRIIYIRSKYAAHFRSYRKRSYFNIVGLDRTQCPPSFLSPSPFSRNMHFIILFFRRTYTFIIVHEREDTLLQPRPCDNVIINATQKPKMKWKTRRIKNKKRIRFLYQLLCCGWRMKWKKNALCLVGVCYRNPRQYFYEYSKVYTIAFLSNCTNIRVVSIDIFIWNQQKKFTRAMRGLKRDSYSHKSVRKTMFGKKKKPVFWLRASFKHVW